MNAADALTGAEHRALATAEPGSAPAVALSGIRKHFTRRDGTKVPAVDGIDLTVAQGEFVVLLGPSGCGKTTLLRCLAGLESPDAGDIAIHGDVHFASSRGIDSSPDQRKLGMVFQSYALWPHMKVFSNVAYPLQVRGMRRSDIRGRVAEVLSTVGIGELHEQYPGQLSGGQQQRVALARALVSSDRLILFDEPLSNVDAKVREQLRYEIRRMQQQMGFAAIYVTHDQEEAMELADRIAVLNRGKIAQLGTAQEIYETPSDLYVAKFIGATNEISGCVVSARDDGTATVTTETGEISGVMGQESLAAGDSVSVIVRPEKCQLLATGNEGENLWPVIDAHAVFMGASRRVSARISGWGEMQVQFSSGETIPDLQADTLKLRIPTDCARIYRR